MVSSLGLRSRLVALILLALAPVLGLVAWKVADDQKEALALARVRLQSEALLAASGQQPLVEAARQLLGDMASGPSVKGRLTDLCVAYLANLQVRQPSYVELGVVALDGTLQCHSDRTQVGANARVGDQPFFNQAMAGGRFTVGGYGAGRNSGNSGIGFAEPVYDAAGMLGAVAFAVLDVRAFGAALAAVDKLDGASAVLTDRNGTVVAAYPEGAGWVGRRHPDPVVRSFPEAPRAGIKESRDAGGEQRVYAFAPVGGSAKGALFVTVSMPLALVSAAPRKALMLELGILLAAALFGMACAWVMGKRMIVNPAGDILREANQLALGNLAARVDIGPAYQGELGHLARTFNRMAESLQVRRQELDATLAQIAKERALLDLIINSMSEGVIAVDVQGRFLLFNAAARKIFPTQGGGAALAAWRQYHALLSVDGKTTYAPENRPLSRALRGESVDNWDIRLRVPFTDDRVLRHNVRPLHDEAGELVGGLVVMTDITERQFAEDFVRDQEQVLELIAGGVALPQSLEAIVRLIEGRMPGGLCSIMLCEGAQLRHGAAPSLPVELSRRLDGRKVGEGAGACGTAAELKKTVVVTDMASDPLMRDYGYLVHEFDLRACWSTPVLSSGGTVLGTFAIYHRTPYEPQRSDHALVDSAVRLARIAIERARADEARRSSEARFRELAENVEYVFYNRDFTSGRFLYISPAYEALWGRSLESLYAQAESYRDAIHPDDLAAEALSRQRLAQGASTHLEYRIIRPDGAVRWIRDHSYPVINSAGTVEHVVGTARDITERKLADVELARSHRALQMLSRCNEALIRIDDEAQLLGEVCRLAVELGGYRMAWVGFAVNDEAGSIVPMARAGHDAGYLDSIKLSWHDDVEIGRGPAGEAIRSGQPQQRSDLSQADSHFNWHVEALQRGYRSALMLPLRDSEHSFGLLGLYASEVQPFATEEVKLLQDMADNLAFGIGSLRARLERRRSQEEARQAAVKLSEQASLLDRAQDAIIVRNLDRTLRYWNKGAERLYGWTAEEVLGKTMDEVMYRSPQLLIAAMNQTQANGGDWTGELEQVARDGSAVTVEARWTVVRDEHGQVNGVLGINTDIRERKRAREEILQLNACLEERVQQRTAQLEFANKQLEAFSYSVSHDLRTPLSAIDGFSNLLGKDLGASASSERSRHYLSRIRAGVSQMGELIDALLSLAQVSRTILRWDSVDLSAMAHAVVDGYREHEPERRVALDIQPGLLAQGDPRLLQQVLDNLLGNAWKFSGKQPQARIAFRREIRPDGEPVYVVQDNGAGFDMAYADKLFGAFERLHTASEFAGTGIGLATVQRIVTRHGGRVWAESAPGLGAMFYFTLGDAPAGDLPDQP